MPNKLVAVAPAEADIRTIDDLISLYRSRVDNPSIRSYSEMMLLTETYQKQAFAMVAELLDDVSRCTSIVEIGCGCGCLLVYLREQGFRGTYAGIDLVDGFVDMAKKRFAQDEAATFTAANFLAMADRSLPGYDHYIATSVFGFVPGENYMREVVAKACRLAQKSVVITCNSNRHQVLPLKARTYSPTDVLSLCLEYGESVDLLHRCVPVEDSHYALIGAMLRTTSWRFETVESPSR